MVSVRLKVRQSKSFMNTVSTKTTGSSMLPFLTYQIYYIEKQITDYLYIIIIFKVYLHDFNLNTYIKSLCNLTPIKKDYECITKQG